ncbi:MAG: hypothetical protein M0P91_09705 [Sulfuricurvum sp.]|uniref:hypothetical protein n=1 Tax=Sulfuricurvum sp. TaxID=2025608 RepID=UPI0025CFC1DB|nr:hypothetical protein [Sulfuricurvum sp.]MCK9373463.1 hypothetical protein [Sulfuricurvum sp.]
MNFITLLVPLAVEIIKMYTKNSDSKKDDKVLQVVQLGCTYLQPKNNNTVDQLAVNAVTSHEMIGESNEHILY